MLRITQQTSAAAAKTYFSSADYFTEGQELEGVWRGKGATELGLAGVVQQSDWDALCDGLDPRNGSPLMARRNATRRVGWDLTFSVPKSISLLYGLSQDERILAAFNESVDQTVDEIESELKTRIRTNGQDSDRITGNGVFARFTHFTARPIDGVPDCHLHAHVMCFNSTFDAVEDRWKAAQIADIKRDANYFNARMHSRLAARLVELGVPIERTATAWRVGGLDEKTDAKFSRRTRAIEAIAQERGITDPQEKAALGAITRDGKNKRLGLAELRAIWLSWLTPDESDVVQRVERSMRAPQPISFDPALAREAIDYAADHHFERESVMPERTLLTTAMHHAIGCATPEMVLGAGHRSDLIVGEERGQTMITSPEVLAEESRMIVYAKASRGAYEPIVAGPPATAPDWFNSGQKKALDHLLTTRNGVVILRGVAGAGKTSLLSEFKQQAEATGQKVYAFAPSTDASRGVLREAGFHDADTLATLLVSSKIQAAMRGQIILVDEAGQISSPQMAKLFELAHAAGARIILSGDRYQHGSVQRGSALRLLEQEAGLKTAALTEIVRQREQYRQAVAYLSQGRVEAGFAILDELGWVQEIADTQVRNDRIAAQYVQATDAGKSVIVVSPTNAESGQVTQAIRSALRHEGRIGSDQASLLKLTNRYLTEAQRRDAVNYADGDIVVFTQNAAGYEKGTRLTVGVDSIPLDRAARFEVYRANRLNLAQGDSVRITRNGLTADGHRVSNGQTFGVRAIAGDGTVTLNNGWRLGPTFGHLDHAYCSTSYASQGKTKDVVIVAAAEASFPAASREQFYVSASRGRTACTIYTDDKEGLLDAVRESGDRITATELTRQIIERSRLERPASINEYMPIVSTQERHAGRER